MATQHASGRAVVGLPELRRPRDLPVEILESKLDTPSIRAGVIRRPQLLTRLRAARALPTVAVVAPARYGKTALLALWAAADDRPFTWLSLDPHDNDPIVLLTHLAVALDRISPLPADTFDALRAAGVSVPATAVPRLGSALSHLPRPLVLVVDDVHHLPDGASLDALVTLVGHVRGTTQVALVGRGMPVPLARQRAQGLAVEIGVDSLAFTEDGAHSSLRAAGAHISAEEVVRLARRTEGRAAGLYLAAPSRTGTSPFPEIAESEGADRLVADHLQSELLSRLPPRDLSLLTRTPVLAPGPHSRRCTRPGTGAGSARVLTTAARSTARAPDQSSANWARSPDVVGSRIAQAHTGGGRKCGGCAVGPAPSRLEPRWEAPAMNEPPRSTRLPASRTLDWRAAEDLTRRRVRHADSLDGRSHGFSTARSGRTPRPRQGSAPAGPPPPWRETGTPGGLVPSDDELLERTLAFSGSYVSDDGHLTIRRYTSGSFEYSGNRFVGYCRRCARRLLIPPDGVPLPDIRAAIDFAATHDHGDVD